MMDQSSNMQNRPKTIQRIPISRPNQNRKENDLFWAGVHQRRNRRLAYEQQQVESERNPESKQQATRMTKATSNTTYGQTSLFNCNGLLYTGTIGIGTPIIQNFTVKFDTSTTISWIPSIHCDQTCHYLPVAKYDSSTSTSYTSYIGDNIPNEFRETYPNLYGGSVRNRLCVCVVVVVE
jgi:hypothetical protein